MLALLTRSGTRWRIRLVYRSDEDGRWLMGRPHYEDEWHDARHYVVAFTTYGKGT